MKIMGALVIERSVTVGLALALLVLGVPQTIDSLLRLYSGLPDVFEGTAKLQPGPAADAAETLLKEADRWIGDPGARTNAGILERRLAFGVDGRVDLKSLDLARQDIESGLARAPANALAWAELAFAQLVLGNPKSAKTALRTSILLAPYEPSLNWWRAQIGLQLWLGLDIDDRKLLSEQLNFGWEQNKQQILDAAKSNAVNALIIRGALATDPDHMTAYERAMTPTP